MAAAGSKDRWEEGREHLEALRCLIRDTAGSHIVLGAKKHAQNAKQEM